MRNSKRGEIVTIVTIGAFVIFSVASLITSYVTNKNNTASNAKAAARTNCIRFPNIGAPDVAPAGYYWEADCDSTSFLKPEIKATGRNYCVDSRECIQNVGNADSGFIDKEKSNFCYSGFGDVTTQRCMMIRYNEVCKKDNGGCSSPLDKPVVVNTQAPVSTTAPQSTTAPIQSAYTPPAPGSCNRAVTNVFYDHNTYRCVVESTTDEGMYCFVRQPAGTGNAVGCTKWEGTVKDVNGKYYSTFSGCAATGNNAEIGGLHYEGANSCNRDTSKALWKVIGSQDLKTPPGVNPAPIQPATNPPAAIPPASEPDVVQPTIGGVTYKQCGSAIHGDTKCVSSSKQLQQCDNGAWKTIGACGTDDPKKSCKVSNVTFEHNSQRCNVSLNKYQLCNDGKWETTSTECRKASTEVAETSCVTNGVFNKNSTYCQNNKKYSCNNDRLLGSCGTTTTTSDGATSAGSASTSTAPTCPGFGYNCKQHTDGKYYQCNQSYPPAAPRICTPTNQNLKTYTINVTFSGDKLKFINGYQFLVKTSYDLDANEPIIEYKINEEKLFRFDLDKSKVRSSTQTTGFYIHTYLIDKSGNIIEKINSQTGWDIRNDPYIEYWINLNDSNIQDYIKRGVLEATTNSTCDTQSVCVSKNKVSCAKDNNGCYLPGGSGSSTPKNTPTPTVTPIQKIKDGEKGGNCIAVFRNDNTVLSCKGTLRCNASNICEATPGYIGNQCIKTSGSRGDEYSCITGVCRSSSKTCESPGSTQTSVTAIITVVNECKAKFAITGYGVSEIIDNSPRSVKNEDLNSGPVDELKSSALTFNMNNYQPIKQIQASATLRYGPSTIYLPSNLAIINLEDPRLNPVQFQMKVSKEQYCP